MEFLVLVFSPVLSTSQHALKTSSHTQDLVLVVGSTSEETPEKMFVSIDLQGPKDVFLRKKCMVAWKLSMLHAQAFSYHF